MTENSDLGKIKKQVEFYFGDSNYRVDKFLREECLKNEGWIPIKTILGFKKLSELTSSIEDVKDALKDSKVVELKDDQIKKIETEEYKRYITSEDIEQRVIHIKGLDKSMGLEDIERLLSKYMDPVLIRMRRDKQRNFKGSVFVELKSVEDVQKALEQKIPISYGKEERKDEESAPDGNLSEGRLENEGVKRVKLDDQVFLEIKTKSGYFQKKKEEKLSEKIERARGKILKEYSGKFYKYEVEKEMDIKTIKSVVPGVAFVDSAKKVLRFKKTQDFEEKDFSTDDGCVKVSKLSESESAEYGKSIKVGKMNKK
jgi:lupus La protein